MLDSKTFLSQNHKAYLKVTIDYRNITIGISIMNAHKKMSFHRKNY